MVFYRTYRPQTIHDLDSEHIRKTFTSLLGSSDVVPHAFLFTGPKGLGKTSTARIVAKIVNCENRKKGTVEPCNTCSSCTTITHGSSLDVLEIDAASNRGIDEIRDLREKVRLSPVSSQKKVYIIDEVHMLTTEAFNALLKTLEEPPSHVMFVLCTTEKQKVPATILSRCFHVAFKPATEAELLRSFQRIVTGEKLAIEEDALQLIAALSDRGFRDGAKMLEEAALLAHGKTITKTLIEETFTGTDTTQAIDQLITFLEKKDTKNAVVHIGRILNEGMNIQYFHQELIQQLHAELLIATGIDEPEKKRRTTLRVTELVALLEALQAAYGQIRYAVLPQLPLELAVITWTQQEEKQRVQPVVQKQQPAAPHPVQKEPFGQAHKEVPPHSSVVPSAVVQPASSKLLYQLIDHIKQHNHSIAGVLRGTTLGEQQGDVFTIETKFSFHKERLDTMEAKKLLEDAYMAVTSQKAQVSILLKQ